MANDRERAVRDYLTYLSDPDSLTDNAAIASAEAAVKAASEPIAKLRALAALERAKHVDGESLRAAFVAEVGAWAKAESIPVQAFRDMGVPDSALAEAGLLMISSGSRRAARQKPPAEKKPRAPRVTLESVRQGIPSGTFTLRAVEQATGASTMTVKKVIDELLASGKVERLGPDKSWQGRGRAPYLYSRV